MNIEVCDLCEDPDRWLDGQCSLCKATVCADFECRVYVKDESAPGGSRKVCIACAEDGDLEIL